MLFRALLKFEYWSMGIKVFNPSFPPDKLIITNTLPSALRLPSERNNGESSKAFTPIPFNVKGKTVPAAALALKKDLRFMAYDNWYSERFMMDLIKYCIFTVAVDFAVV